VIEILVLPPANRNCWWTQARRPAINASTGKCQANGVLGIIFRTSYSMTILSKVYRWPESYALSSKQKENVCQLKLPYAAATTWTHRTRIRSGLVPVLLQALFLPMIQMVTNTVYSIYLRSAWKFITVQLVVFVLNQRRYVARAQRFANSYRCGLDGQQAAYASKVCRGH